MSDLAPQDFREVFDRLGRIWCADTHEMLWEEEGQLHRRYYRTEHWRRYRRRKIAAADERCQLCGRRFEWGYDLPRVHHLSYVREDGRTTLGRERLSDCLCLCEECHALEHATHVQETLDLFDAMLCGG